MPPDHAASSLPAVAPYPGFVRWWLRIDLALCVVVGLAALIGTANLLRGEIGDYDRTHAIAETLIQYGTATFGILGDVLLLRRRRAGCWLACVALAFVGASMALVLHAMQLRMAAMDPDEAAAFAVGVVLILCCRGAIHLVYAYVLRRAWRSLSAAVRPATP